MRSMTSSVAVVGAAGRMGRLAARLVAESPHLELALELGSRDGLDRLAEVDIAIDFTTPQVSPTVVDTAVTNGVSVVVGSSGWSSERLTTLERSLLAHPDVGVIVAPNFSIGSVLATNLATQAARFFESIEIVETHHAAKIDSPSGTAVRTAESIAAARAELGPVSAPHVDQRARGQQIASVPVHSLRMDGVLARQEVHFGGDGESLTIAHSTLSYSSYEAGIRAALAAIGGTRGLVVGLESVLGLTAPASGDAS